MSNKGGSKRPTKLVNLTQDDDQSSSPVNIPRSSSRQKQSGGRSAPSLRTPLSSSLVEPVIDESDVMLSTSSVKSDTSAMERRKEAAKGALGEYSAHHHYGAIETGGYGYPDDGHGGPSDIQQSAEFTDDFEKIASRHKREEHATSNLETAIHVLKGNVGTGLLALPLAVYNAGLIVGAVGLLFMGVVATHCMLLLVSCARELCRRLGVQTLNYAEVAQMAVLEYAQKPVWGKVASVTVNIFLIITQFGFCCVYFVFMADNLDQVFCSAFNISLGQRAWIGILIVPVVVLSWIRNLDELSSFSMVANVCILVALLIILYAEINSFVTSAKDERAAVLTGPLRYGAIGTLPLFFGQVVFAFEGIGVVLPLENKMKTPKDAIKVITGSMVIVALLYVVFGVLGYIVYGSNIKGSITLNLITSNFVEAIFFNIAKLFYTYAILSSFLLQFYVPMDFLEPPLYEKLPYYFPRHHNKLKFLVQILFRTVLVLLTAGIALAVPDLDDLISLIGAVASSALALIFPPILSILVFWRIRSDILWFGCLPWPVWVVKDVLIALLGVVGTLFGTYASIDNIVNFFHKQHTAEKACDITYFPH